MDRQSRSKARTPTGFSRDPARRLLIRASPRLTRALVQNLLPPRSRDQAERHPSIRTYPGTYTVTYTSTDGTHQTTATRTVIVGTFPEDEVDQPGTANIPPTLTLNGDDQIIHECGNAFTDPGATATVCGSPVTVTTSGTVNPNAPGTYTITYSASANGFTTEVTRIVTVQDTVAPVITLNGNNPMQVGFGTVFTDPGATASDGCAGDLTSSIVVTGSVDTNTVGFYALTYHGE